MSTCCRWKRTNRRCARIWLRCFPPWQPTGPDGLGPPALPAWLQTELRARGALWTVSTQREPKRRHGRREERMLRALADPAVNAYVGSAGTVGQPWPHLQQVCRVERRRTLVRRGQVVREEREVSYAITSAPAEHADAARLLRVQRGHWGIENKVHWVRDVTFGEDSSRVRTGAAPEVLAACRNVVTALLRRAGYDNIAAALRTLAGRYPAAVALVLASAPK